MEEEYFKPKKCSVLGTLDGICTKVNETLILALVALVLNSLILHFLGQINDSLACIELYIHSRNMGKNLCHS